MAFGNGQTGRRVILIRLGACFVGSGFGTPVRKVRRQCLCNCAGNVRSLERRNNCGCEIIFISYNILERAKLSNTKKATYFPRRGDLPFFSQETGGKTHAVATANPRWRP